MAWPSIASVMLSGFLAVAAGGALDDAPFEVIVDFTEPKTDHRGFPSREKTLEAFLDKWDFFDKADPTHGFVRYVDRQSAFNRTEVGRPLVELVDGTFVVRSEPAEVKEEAPYSIRLESKVSFDAGTLFVASFGHMPDHCGSWPAFWLLGEGNWPENGEIDIIENVGGEIPIVNTRTHTSLHTLNHCEVGVSGEADDISGAIFSKDCRWNKTDGSNSEGCVTINSDDHSFGKGFNKRGGGTYAVLWTDSSVQAWFWQASKEPADVKNGRISKSSMADWSKPYTKYYFGPKCSSRNFKKQRIVLNSDFCGGWAGKSFKKFCPVEGMSANGMRYFFDHDTNENCERFLSTDIGRAHLRDDAHWTINSMRTYAYNWATQEADVVV